MPWKSRGLVRGALSVMALIITPAAPAQDDFFEPISVNNIDPPTSATDPNLPMDYRGTLKQNIQYGLDKPLASEGFARNSRGISQVMTELFGELQWQTHENAFVQISAQAESDWYQWEHDERQWRGHNQTLRLRDAFFDVVFDSGTWLRLGNQVLAWGEAEGLTITDVFSTTDQRQPGQAELKDIRQPVPALMVRKPITDTFSASIIVTDHAGHNRYADAGEPFDFFTTLRTAGFSARTRNPENSREYGVRVSWRLNGSDLHWVSARVNRNDLSLEAVNPTIRSITLGQQRLTVHGISANRALGNWLLKGEAGYWSDVPMAATDAWVPVRQTRSMAGAEYAGFDQWTLSAELNHIRREDKPENTATDKSEWGYVLRVTHNAFNNRLHNQWWAIHSAELDGTITRWNLLYSVTDRLKAGLDLTAYHIGNQSSLLHPFRHHDSVNVSLTYHF